METDASPFPRRERKGVHEVLIATQDMWLQVESEEDAKAIAAAPVLENDGLNKLRTGEGFATELERTADALAKYGIGFGSRFFRRRAEEARRTVL